MTSAASQTGAGEIVVDEIFPHAPETIWKTLTSGALMGRWLGMEPSGFEPVVGNRFTYRTTPAGEWDGTIQCEVLEVIPDTRFAYSWKGGHEGNVGYGSRLDTVVTFTLESVDGGTRLRLVHSGFVLPRNDSAYRTMSGGWTQVVSRIGAITGGQDS
ncbi:SRPBCC family protein [Sphingomonas sp. DT-204]|uniref:SRPBCC family protein n=1 Tax=Sphingomonas sp. DT-204 TaxID=3396166 RepID=UPI003F1B506F